MQEADGVSPAWRQPPRTELRLRIPWKRRDGQTLRGRSRLRSLGLRHAHNAGSPSQGLVVLRAFRLAEMTMGPGSCLCPARAALPVPLGPPLAQVACPSPFPEPRGAEAPDGARSRWRPSPRVCKFGGEQRAGLGVRISGNGAPVGDLVWPWAALGCESRCWSRPRGT